MLRFLTHRRLFWGLLLFSAVSVAALLSAPFGPPNDPLYEPACGPFPPCTVPPGQWDLRSDVRTQPATNHPSGISVDQAWQLSVGRPDVVAVVFDTGVNYDHVDLRNQIWLNRGELPVPNNAGATCALVPPNTDPYDCNNDGIFNVLDFATDSRITNTILPAVLSRSDLRVFEDGADGDGNGYVDDISGYDFDDGDPDEYDHRDFGHGTGRNGFIAAETNNLTGIAGICPNCRLANARIDDTFVPRTEGTANAMVWAADHGFELVNMALGHTTSGSASRAAFDYGTRHNVLAFSAIANEFHFHQGYVGIYDDVVAIGAVTFASAQPGTPNAPPVTYLRKANFSNFGAHLEVVAPTDSLTTNHGSNNQNDAFATSTGTSSAVPHAAGTAALIISYGRDRVASGALSATGLALPELSAQEVRQILSRTADDVTTSEDNGYAVTPGWDKFTGYGRINARKALDRITSGRIPPEADINSPDWYTYNSPGPVTVGFYANNRWRGNYDWKLEVGEGLAPASFTQIASGSGSADKALSSTNMVNNFTAAWDTSAVTVFTAYTLKLTVTDSTDTTNFGEDRMAVYVRPPDTTAAPDHPGWPKRLMNGTLPISAESFSTALVDLDGDNKLEVILNGSGDGRVFAFHENGTPVAGFPVMTNPPPIGMPSPLNASPAFDGNAANGEVPVTGASVLGGPVVGDIDRDGVQEICVAAYDGRVYCWNADGSVQPGFPVSIDIGRTRGQYPPNGFTDNLRGEAIISPPVLRNLDGDAAGTLEIVVPALDQKLYAWKADGNRVTGFPVTMFDATQPDSDPTTQKAPKGAIATPIVANIDNSADGSMEIVAATNEGYGSTGNASGRIYAFSNSGSLLPGWPVRPAALVTGSIPIVAEGVGGGPLAADVDGNGDLEIIGMAWLGDPTLYEHTGAQTRTFKATAGGGATSDANEETPAGGFGGPATDASPFGYVGFPALGDVGSDGTLNYLTGSVGAGLIVNSAAGTGSITNFEFYLSSWGASNGVVNQNFPRVLEGWQFFNAPIVADLDGDNKREVFISTSGNFAHVFNSAGADVNGWHKRIGHWSVATPSTGDLDGDGDLEVVLPDRLGYVNVWNTAGDGCSAQWRKFRHDEWNTGALGTDTLRPAKVANLSGTPNGSMVDLTWTAVGDDQRCGTATTYELRRSSSPITEANFASAQVVSGLSTPKASGQSESFRVPQSGGDYLALRVVDEVGNRSPISPFVLNDLDVNTVTGTAANPSGIAGQTVTVGSFTLTNGSPRAHSVSQLTFSAGHPEVLSSLSITGGGASFSCVRLTSPAGFRCTANPAAIVPANGSATFTVQASIAAPASAALSQQPGVMLAGASTLGGLMLLGLMGVRRRTLLWLLPVLLALSVLQGCGGGSSNDDDTPPPTSANSTTLSLTGITASDSQGAVSYGGLPLNLGTVTRTP